MNLIVANALLVSQFSLLQCCWVNNNTLSAQSNNIRSPSIERVAEIQNGKIPYQQLIMNMNLLDTDIQLQEDNIGTIDQF